MTNNWIRVYDDVIEEELCTQIINALADVPLSSAIVNDASDNLSRTTRKLHFFSDDTISVLDDKTKQIVYDKMLVDNIQNKLLKEYVKDTHNLLNIHVPLWNISQYDYLKYGKNQGEYKIHVDNSYIPKDTTHHRILTIIIYLNDITDGGETIFPYQEIEIKPKRARAVIFPSDWTYPHRANKPKSEDKHILTSWVSII